MVRRFKKATAKRRGIRKGGRRLTGVPAFIRAGSAALNTGAAIYKAVRKYTKKPKLNKKITQDGTGSSMSTFSRTGRIWPKARKVMKSSEIQRINNVYSLNINTTTNQQGVQAIGLANKGDLSSMVSQIQNLNNTNGTSGTLGSSASRVNTMDFVLKSGTQDVYFTNTSSGNIFLDLYEIVAREDNNQTITNAWGTGMADEQGSSIGGGINSMFTTPFQSSTFCSLYKIEKVFHIEMAQGRTHKHRQIIHYNQVVDTERILLSSSIKGLTRWLMPVVYGAPTDAAVGTTVTTNYASIDIVVNQKYDYQFLVANYKGFTYTNSLTNVVSSLVMNEGSGTAVGTTEA